jgi:hypothetical protein
MKNNYKLNNFDFVQLWKRLIPVLLVCVILTNAKADGIGWNPTGNPARPGQINISGFNNLGGAIFTNPTVQYAFVYLKEGESFFYEIKPHTASSTNTLLTSVYSPLGQVGTEETIQASPVSTHTKAILVTAENEGIWTLRMQTTASNVNWGFNLDARTDPSNAATRVGGRVYTELLHMFQLDGGTNNIPMYIITPSGHKYNLLLNGYNGAGSSLSSDQFGITSKTDCMTPLYKSKEWLDPAIRNLNEPTCGSYNKLFFTPIDMTLPSSAPRWNIATGQSVSEYLNPPVSGPVVTELTYQANGTNALSGDITFKVSDFIGNAVLQLDLDNDGVYGGANDRNLPFSVSNANSITVDFDGLNVAGSALAADSKIKAKILIDRTGEVHVTMIDVEFLTGMKIERTTGDLTGASNLYWDDTELTETGKSSVTSVKDGTAGVDSSVGLGVHGWAGTAPNQWGNSRLIDNWTYVGAASTQEISVEGCVANAGVISRQ